MAKTTQSESSLSVDRRQLLASAAVLSIGTVPGIEAAAEVTNSGPAVPRRRNRKIGDCGLERMRRDRSEN